MGVQCREWHNIKRNTTDGINNRGCAIVLWIGEWRIGCFGRCCMLKGQKVSPTMQQSATNVGVYYDKDRFWKMGFEE